MRITNPSGQIPGNATVGGVVAAAGWAPDYGVSWAQVYPTYYNFNQSFDGSAGSVRCWPFVIPVDMTIDEWTVEHTTAGTGTARYGIWALDGANGAPSTLLKELGTADIATTGTHTFTSLALSLDAGTYAFGVARQGTISGGTYRAGLPVVPTQLDATYHLAHACGWSATGETGALSASLPSPNPTAAYAPVASAYKRTA